MSTKTNKSTFTPDLETMEFVLNKLQETGVQNRGCSWITTHDEIKWDGENFVAENFVTKHTDPELYHATLIDQIRPRDGHQYRGLMFAENDHGRDKIGDVVVEIRLDPSDGRYKVHFELEQVFSDEETFENLPRATRSSLDNPHQALRRRSIDLSGGIWSNPRRIVGKRIAQHSINPNWADNVPEEEFMDVYDYVDTTDAMGHSTLLRSLKRYPAVVADEIYRQMRDPDRKKKVK